MGVGGGSLATRAKRANPRATPGQIQANPMHNPSLLGYRQSAQGYESARACAGRGRCNARVRWLASGAAGALGRWAGALCGRLVGRLLGWTGAGAFSRAGLAIVL